MNVLAASALFAGFTIATPAAVEDAKALKEAEMFF